VRQVGGRHQLGRKENGLAIQLGLSLVPRNLSVAVIGLCSIHPLFHTLPKEIGSQGDVQGRQCLALVLFHVGEDVMHE
jgi:hypothetical protein